MGKSSFDFVPYKRSVLQLDGTFSMRLRAGGRSCSHSPVRTDHANAPLRCINLCVYATRTDLVMI